MLNCPEQHQNRPLQCAVLGEYLFVEDPPFSKFDSFISVVQYRISWYGWLATHNQQHLKPDVINAG